MQVRSVVWGGLLIAMGVLLLGGWLPGVPAMAMGPRIGVGMALLMLGALALAIPGVQWWLRRAAPEEARCPVGESCAGCGAFNLKPRHGCRVCGAPVNAA